MRFLAQNYIGENLDRGATGLLFKCLLRIRPSRDVVCKVYTGGLGNYFYIVSILGFYLRLVIATPF